MLVTKKDFAHRNLVYLDTIKSTHFIETQFRLFYVFLIWVQVNGEHLSRYQISWETSIVARQCTISDWKGDQPVT